MFWPPRSQKSVDSRMRCLRPPRHCNWWMQTPNRPWRGQFCCTRTHTGNCARIVKLNRGQPKQGFALANIPLRFRDKEINDLAQCFLLVSTRIQRLLIDSNLFVRTGALLQNFAYAHDFIQATTLFRVIAYQLDELLGQMR